MRGLPAIAALTIIAAAASSPAVAEPVQVFNLPLGGKAIPPIRVCKVSDLTDVRSKTICTVEKPKVYSDGAYAKLHYPSERLPLWAANGEMTILTDGSGTLQEISLRTADDVKLDDVIQSIAMRFGSPTITKLQGTAKPTARWDQSNIIITAEKWGHLPIEVHFRTPLRVEAVAKAQREHEAKERQRPAMP